MNTRETERELVAAVVGGAPGAWERLVTRFERLVYAVPLRMGLKPEDSEEVFQNTWLILCRHIGLIRAPDLIASWIVTTASREAWRLKRRDDRRRAEDVDEGEDRAVDPLPDPGELLIELETRRRIEDAIDGLRPVCRDLIRLLFRAERTPSYEELARELKVPVGSLGPTRQRCLAQLAQLIDFGEDR